MNVVSDPMFIPYANRSSFFTAIEAALNAAGHCPDVASVTVQLPPGGYDGSIVVDTSPDSGEGFEADWENSDPTRFPARIRAAASVLHRRGCHGRFLVTHQDGDLIVGGAP